MTETPNKADPPSVIEKSCHGTGAGGSNLSRVRVHNERLVLSLLRAESLSRAEIARRTGLSAQTISLIVRALTADGLIRSGRPIKGRVGQPSVPLTLEPLGAAFAGLKIGRRSAELILIDFTGAIVASRELTYAWPESDVVVSFVAREWPGLIEGVARRRLHGLGVAMPFDAWQWSRPLDTPDSAARDGRDHPLIERIGEVIDLPVHVVNDATAACGAELTFGRGREHRNFGYFFIGHFVGGGLVLDGSVHGGPGGNAAAFGSLPVRDPDRPGHLMQLIDAASLRVLETMISTDGEALEDDVALHRTDSRLWHERAEDVAHWQTRAADALATAIVSITAVTEVDTIIIDGAIPDAVRSELCRLTSDALALHDTRGLQSPTVIEGSVGSRARTLGAARLPMFARFLLDQDVLTRLAS